MVEQRGSRFVWSAVLIAGGTIALLFNLNVLSAYEPLAQYILAGALAVGGVSFFVSYAASSGAWWRLIPAWTLLALAAMVLLSALRPEAGRWVAAILFWGLALAFAQLYARARAEHWWAILPGGFMVVLGVVVALSGRITSLELLGAILFAGIGGVFFLLYLLGGAARQWWALIPGSILILFGLFILTMGGAGRTSALRWWPLLAIAAGGLLLWRALRPQRERLLEVNRAPAVRPAAATLAAPAASTPAPGASVQVLSSPDDV